MIAWLIDNADAFRALVDAIQGARESVWITQLALDADCVVYGDAGNDWLLLDALVNVSAIADVRILLNATLLLDTSRPLLRALRARADGGGGVAVRGIRRFPRLLHAKMVIIDRTRAFLLGSPFVNGYWDTSQHAPLDPRRPPRELAGRPIHDVSVAVTGATVATCVELFEELWQLETDHVTEVMPTESPYPRVTNAPADIEVVTTLPAAVLRSSPRGSRGTLDALLDGIRAARRLIYIEHQYLSARPVVDALVAALERAPALEIIMVLNENPDVTAYRGWQTVRLSEAGLLQHPRVGVFALWSTQRTNSGVDINQIFVHSKVVIVDDEWALVGSANLDGVSLHSYGDDFSGGLARRIFRDVRNVDVGVVVRGGHEGRPRELRERLWREHLGVDSADLPAADAAALGYWRAAAASNVQTLNDPIAGPMKGFVLPFSLLATPADQLADVGVRSASARLNLCFNPGWLEVNFSPNWVRNMFL